jgi:excisionase family DNA binding protein
VTVKQAAARLEVSSATIYVLVAAGKLKCHRVGLGRGAIRITEEHVVEFLKGSERAAPSAPLPRYKPKHVKVKTS